VDERAIKSVLCHAAFGTIKGKAEKIAAKNRQIREREDFEMARMAQMSVEEFYKRELNVVIKELREENKHSFELSYVMQALVIS
jgi:predicted secreted Zn-dependent protease